MNLQQKQLSEEIHFPEGQPKPFGDSIYPDYEANFFIDNPEPPPNLKKLENLILNNPAIYALEPPTILFDEYPATPEPRWEITSIKFLNITPGMQSLNNFIIFSKKKSGDANLLNTYFCL